MNQIPRDSSFDSILALKYQGYEFISKRCSRCQSKVFETRLLFQNVICMRGKEAAKLFYDTDRFKREGAVPPNIRLTLFGSGGVQGLDDQAHYHRKKLFMDLMNPKNIQDLISLSTEQWQAYAQKWKQQDNITLFHEVQELLCKAVCEWMEIYLQGAELHLRTDDLAAMIDGAGSMGLRYFKARQARKRTEKWASKLIDQTRRRYIKGDGENVIHHLANYSNAEGTQLNLHTAAVELINILRPTVAVARYITFAALALHKYPEYRAYLQSGDNKSLMSFIQEVRRFYPFFPFAIARVRKNFEWNGYHFPEGRRVLLDLYGTNHDPRLWKDPEKFNPERFHQRQPGPFDLIPQGGGHHHLNHRCPGELATIQLLKTGIEFLLQNIRYQVPDQNLSIRLSRIPAIPKSRFRINNVRLY